MIPNKRAIALEEGATHYFNGKPCKNGHVANRRTINGCCVACEAAKNNREDRKRYMAEYAHKNREKIRAIASNWQANNKGKVNANTALRHTAKMKRTPTWLSKEEKQRIKCLYQLSAMYSRESGYDWHVDHTIPLQGETVSGLHVYNNLRVVPAVENMRKNNRYNG